MPYKSLEITPANAVQQQAVQTNQFYVGFSSLDPANTAAKLFDFELIKQDIINHFNTRKGERVMNPTFGTIIWDLIMEPLTEQTRELLNNDITAICNYDPRVVPTQINLIEYQTGYIIELTLQLVGTDQSANLRLDFDQQIGLSIR
jgi:phage baseplate assembly protein W